MIGSGLQEQASAKLAELVADHPARKRRSTATSWRPAFRKSRIARTTPWRCTSRWPNGSRQSADGALYREAHLTLRSNRAGKEEEARKRLEGLIRQYAK